MSDGVGINDANTGKKLLRFKVITRFPVWDIISQGITPYDRSIAPDAG
jgi:hypothetical protein